MVQGTTRCCFMCQKQHEKYVFLKCLEFDEFWIKMFFCQCRGAEKGSSPGKPPQTVSCTIYKTLTRSSYISGPFWVLRAFSLRSRDAEVHHPHQDVPVGSPVLTMARPTAGWKRLIEIFTYIYISVCVEFSWSSSFCCHLIKSELSTNINCDEKNRTDEKYYLLYRRRYG